MMDKSNLYLPAGVDLGRAGGFALLNQAHVIAWFYTPSKKHQVNYLRAPKSKAEASQKEMLYCHSYLTALLRTANLKAKEFGYAGMFVAVEDWQQRPGKNNPKSYLSTGACLATWKGALIQEKIPFAMVSPTSWKSAMGLTSDKSLSLKAVQNLLKSYPVEMIGDDNLAEAALLALWVDRFHTNRLSTEFHVTKKSKPTKKSRRRP